MNISMLPDINEERHAFFPGLEVVAVDDDLGPRRGVITVIDVPRQMLTLVLDACGTSRFDYPSSSCYVPGDAGVRMVVSQVVTYSFCVPVEDLDLDGLSEHYGIMGALDDWFCNQENNERDAITYEVESREIEPGLNRRA